MLKNMITLAACALFLSGVAAASNGPVSSSLTAYAVTKDEEGNEAFTQADSVKPGQLIEYRIIYKNESAEPLSSFVINGDVPEATQFVAASANSSVAATFEVEVFDLGWVTPPAFREVTRADGTVERVAVPASDYSAVRWKLADPLAAGVEVETTYRVQVDE